MEPKKISFGFMKTKKADKPLAEEKRDFIECVEEKSIKVVGGDKIEEKHDLVIPMKPNTMITAERLQQIAQEVERSLEEPEPTDKPPQAEKIQNNENLTLEQMAEQELLQDAKREVRGEKQKLSVPITQPPLEGQKESTLDDYESVPIQDFGMAMLRGMGWTPSKDQDNNKYKQPILRPKGLGLGADKLIKPSKSKGKEDEEELMVVKNGFVKITNGKYNGYYGKVISLDEDNGRALVDITIKKETVSLSEFMMVAVTKTEFDQQSRILNAEKFEKYKSEKHNIKPEKSSKRPEKLSSHNSRSRNERNDKNGKETSDKKSSYENKSKSRRDEKRYSSNESIDSIDLDNRQDRRNERRHSEDRSKRREKKYDSDSLSSISDSDLKPKHKDRRKSSSDSDSSDYQKKSRKSKKTKRDIDKKRKGKKKKRDRDRSPNYKKHRK